MPADSGGIEENVRALQSRQARALGIPLIPTDQRSYSAVCGIKRLEPAVSSGEVELRVIKRIVGDVPLAVYALQRPVCVQNRCGVVVEPPRAPLEDRSHHDDLVLSRHRLQDLGRGPRDRLVQIEQGVIFTLAEIFGSEQPEETDNIRTFLPAFANLFDRATKVLLRLGRARHLDQTNSEGVIHKDRAISVPKKLPLLPALP